MDDKRWELLKEPREEHWEKVEVTYCKYCGRVKRGDRRGYFNVVKHIAKKYADRIARRLPPGYRVKTFKVFKLDEERDGYRLYEVVISVDGPEKRRIVRHFRLRQNLGVCPRCSRKLTGYYEALVQIRGPKEKVERAFEEIRPKVEVLDSFVRYERVDEGINVYFLDHPPARRLVDELLRRWGGKHIVTRSLLKIEDGKRKGIETHSVRLPEFNPGDLVKLDERYFVFKRIKRGWYELLRMPDLKTIAFPPRARIEFESKPLSGIVLDSDESVATIFLDGRTVYAKVSGRMRPGEEAVVYKIGETYVAIPKRKLDAEGVRV